MRLDELPGGKLSSIHLVGRGARPKATWPEHLARRCGREDLIRPGARFDDADDPITVDPETGCWLWRRYRSHGYGAVGIDGRSVRVHRLTYAMGVDPSLDLTPGKGTDQQVDHLCRVRDCVNPDHLRIVSNRENTCAGLVARNADDRAVGAYWEPRFEWWVARITHTKQRRYVHLGTFGDQSTAARIYDAARWLIDGSTPNADRGICAPPDERDIEFVRNKLARRSAGESNSNTEAIGAQQ